MNQDTMNAALLKYRQDLLGYIFALTRDYEIAEEIFQEVALVILNEAATGRKVRKFSAWAREIARRRVANFFRGNPRRSKTQPLEESMVESISSAFDEEAAEGSASDGLRLKFLRQCLEKLSRRAREAIDCRYRDRMQIAQIAAAMGWQVTAVNTALSKAKGSLAQCIGRKLRSAGAQ